MTPRQLLDCARTLLAGPDEAHWRAAVSRGYYAAFHATQALFWSLRFRIPDDGSAHRYLSDRLQNAVEPDWESAGWGLEGLRTARTEADYELSASFGVTWAERMLRSAEDYFDLLDQLRADPATLRAVQAMVVYERGRRQVTYFGP
ncbi:MAG: HEPN domain-containing protein [Gemmataceae bacterium]